MKQNLFRKYINYEYIHKYKIQSYILLHIFLSHKFLNIYHNILITTTTTYNNFDYLILIY